MSWKQKAYLTNHQSLSGYIEIGVVQWYPNQGEDFRLENRPSFDRLTPTQRNSLKGENGHSLSVSVRIERVLSQQRD